MKKDRKHLKIRRVSERLKPEDTFDKCSNVHAHARKNNFQQTIDQMQKLILTKKIKIF